MKCHDRGLLLVVGDRCKFPIPVNGRNFHTGRWFRKFLPLPPIKIVKLGIVVGSFPDIRGKNQHIEIVMTGGCSNKLYGLSLNVTDLRIDGLGYTLSGKVTVCY